MKRKRIFSQLKFPFILLLLITIIQFFRFTIAIDKYIEDRIYPLFNGKLVFIFSVLSFSASLKIASLITLIVIFILFIKRNHRAWILIGIFYTLTIIFEVILKEIVKKPRPDISLYRSNLEHITRSYAYPSGHCIRAVFVYGILYEVLKKYFYEGLSEFFYSYLFTTLIALICISRMAIGAHWFSDLVGGALAGWIFFVAIRDNYL